MKNNEIRLDEMDLREVDELYYSMFGSLIPREKYKEAYKRCDINYKEMIEAEKNKISAPPSLGRGYKYVRNMIYGWFIEDLFYELLCLNNNVLKIETTGNDKEHKILYDYNTKKLKILGEKTTVPDFLLTLNSGKKLYFELKTAAKEIYTVKIGNVKQIYKIMGESQIFSCIIMIDLINETYGIYSIENFINQHPFVNKRMEGQLCYDIPIPTKKFKEIVNEDFNAYINTDVFSILDINKYKYLFKVKGKIELEKIIKEKIKLDDLYFQFKFYQDEFEEKKRKILEKFNNIDIVNTTWEEIFKKIDNEYER